MVVLVIIVAKVAARVQILIELAAKARIQHCIRRCALNSVESHATLLLQELTVPAYRLCLLFGTQLRVQPATQLLTVMLSGQEKVFV